MLDEEREIQFLQTIITAKAATVDRTSESEIKVYNDLLSEYRTLIFNLNREIDTESASDEQIMESDLSRLIGKEGGKEKKVVISASVGEKITKDITSTSIKNIKDIIK